VTLTRRRSVLRAALLLIVVATFAALVQSTTGPPPPTPNPPGTFAFGTFGDAPYYPWEDWRYPGATPSFAFEQRLVPRWKYW
jgi:hypothetical protein